MDSYSTDGTFDKLTANPKVKVFQKKFKDFADQRNYAIAKANNDWILFLDADERLTKNLKEEILEIVSTGSEYSAFAVHRLHYFGDKRILFSGYQTDSTYRLFKNGYFKYDEDRLVHEMPIIKGKTGRLKGKMEHFSFESFDSLKAKVEKYADLKAHELASKGKKSNWIALYMKPVYKFLYNYLIRLGILDGKEGFIICYLNAYGVYYRYKSLGRLNSIG